MSSSRSWRCSWSQLGGVAVDLTPRRVATRTVGGTIASMTSQKGVNAGVWRLMDSPNHHDPRKAVALIAGSKSSGHTIGGN